MNKESMLYFRAHGSTAMALFHTVKSLAELRGIA